jgi:protein gp37
MNYQGKPGSGKGIEWLQPPVGRGYTWNPIEGCTNTWCEVRAQCWARSMAKRHGDADFGPEFWEYRLGEPWARREPSLIGVCLMGDLFCDGVPDWWIWQVLANIRAAPHHVFLLLTKNVTRLHSVDPLLRECPNLWIGTSISTATTMARVTYVQSCAAHHRFLSFEPLRDAIQLRTVDVEGIEWIIIGGQSRPDARPEKAWIDSLIEQAHARNIPVLVKRNAGYHAGSNMEDALYRLAWATTVGPVIGAVQEWPAAILEQLQV